MLRQSQHDFMKGKSCLPSINGGCSSNAHYTKPVDVHLDLKDTCDEISNKSLLRKITSSWGWEYDLSLDRRLVDEQGVE